MLKRIKEKELVLFAIVLMIWGIVFGHLIIPFQTPDEGTHLELIGKSVHNDKLAPSIQNDIQLDTGRIIFHTEEKVNTEQLESALGRSPQYKVGDCLPNGISFEVIKHLPATIGIYLGILLRLPSYWVMTLGEFFSLLFYMGVCLYTLKVVPRNKEIFAIIMLIPMNVQQATSISYDAVLLPLCYLFVGYLYRIRIENRKTTNKELIGMLLLWSLITYLKLPYGALGLLFFMVPINMYVISVRGKDYNLKNNLVTYLIICIGIIIVVGSALYLLRNDVNAGVLAASVKHPRHTLILLFTSIRMWWKFLMISLVGEFGHLDAPIPEWSVYLSVVAIIIIALIRNKEDETINRLKISDRILFFLTACVISVLVFLSMIRHTYMMIYYGNERLDIPLDYNQVIYAITYIGGLQGRYFLPVLLPFVLTISELKSFSGKYRRIVICALTAFWIICSCVTVKVRYFG